MTEETRISNEIADYLTAHDFGVVRVNTVARGKFSSYNIKNKYITVNKCDVEDIECEKGDCSDCPSVLYELNPKWKSSGFSDLIAIKCGVTYYIEVKTPTGKQSDRQKEFELFIDSCGGFYFLADCIEDVKELAENDNPCETTY